MRWPGRIGPVVRVPLGLISLVPIATYLWVAIHQIGYPFELEWMEGGAVEVVRRVALGQGIYVKPSLHFVPWPYTPLYWWLSAGVSHLTGMGFFPLRLVSLVASIATFVVLGLLVRAETGEWVAGLAAAGIYAASFRLAGDWFAIGRIDSLFLLLLLLTVAAARRTSSWAGGLGIGVLAFLAFFTKQSALLAVAPVLVYLLVTRWRAALAATGTLVSLVAISTVAMDAATGGWYRYYVFQELTHQGIASNEWAQFWSQDLRPFWLAGVVALVGLVVWAATKTVRTPRDVSIPSAGEASGRAERWRRPGPIRPRWERAGYYCAAVAGMVGASWVSRLHSGGYRNVLMPAYAGIALLAGLGLGTLAMRVNLHQGAAAAGDLPARRQRIGSTLRRSTVALGASGMIVAQLALLRYPVAAQIPTSKDVAAGGRLLSEIKALPGQVVVLDHPWYATEVGKGNFADVEALHDVLRAGPSRARTDLAANLATAVSAPQIGAVLLDNPGNEEGFRAGLHAGFEQAPITWAPGNNLFPVVGDLASRPTLLFVRKPVSPSPGAGH